MHRFEVESIAKELDSLKERMRILERLTERLKKKPEEEDEIFLLSTQEYEKYKDAIPEVNTAWWLRSFGGDSDCAALVSNDGSVNDYGYSVYCNRGAVRPVIKIGSSCNTTNLIPHKFIKYNFPWIYIGDGLAIAEVPIAFRRFDSKSNVYESSEVRQFLLDWTKTQ